MQSAFSERARPVTGPAARPFQSLQELQSRHSALSEVAKDLRAPDAVQQVEEFVRRAIETGAILDTKHDRTAAQGLINFWTARLAAAEREAASAKQEEILPRIEDTLLAEFDARSHLDLVSNAESSVQELIQLDSSTEEVIRCVLLQLVGLTGEGSTFVSRSVPRTELVLCGDAYKVERVVSALTQAGVLNEAGADNSIQLTQIALTRHWPRLAEWLEKRAMFRDAAAFWDKHNRDAAALFSGILLDEARVYHDRNRLEEAFFAACESEIERQRIANTWATRRWRAKALTFFLMLVIACVTGIWALYWERHKAEVIEDQARLKEYQRDVERQEELAKTLKEQAEKEQKAAERTRETAIRTSLLLFLLQALGDVASAKSDDERSYARSQWDALAKTAELDPMLTEKLRGFQDTIEQVLNSSTAKSSAVQSDSFKVAQRQVLSMANQIRDELVATGDHASISQLEALRVVAFMRVEMAAGVIVKSAAMGKSFNSIRQYAQDFWKLYWGVMGLVEGPAVERAMVRFGRSLGRWEEAGNDEAAKAEAIQELQEAQQNLLAALLMERKERLRPANREGKRY